MNKKDYQKPAMRVVLIQHTGMLMASNEVHSFQKGGYVNYGGSDADYEGDVR